MEKFIVSEEYKIAATEVLSILEYLPKNTVDKIPNKFIEFLKENSIEGYNPKFDYSLGLDKIELRNKTKLLLAMIYKNYICSDEKILEYSQILNNNEELYEKNLREKYNPDNIFKKVNDNSNVEIQETSTALVKYKESIFTKLINFISRILNKE